MTGARVFLGSIPGSWVDRAACDGEPTDVFFPPPVHFGPVGNAGEHQYDAARAICADCDVRDECLSFALDTGEIYGVWGGKTERERVAIRRRIRRDQSNQRSKETA